MSLLEVKGLNTYYGDSHILFDVSLAVERNEVVALLGRNGAGKSTTLKSLMGVVAPRFGSIIFDGADMVGKKVIRSPKPEFNSSMRNAESSAASMWKRTLFSQD
jgi:branched-chain amino acid transport system ATP-binding protein